MCIGFNGLCQHTLSIILVPDYAKAKWEHNYVVGEHNFIIKIERETALTTKSIIHCNIVLYNSRDRLRQTIYLVLLEEIRLKAV